MIFSDLGYKRPLQSVQGEKERQRCIYVYIYIYVCMSVSMSDMNKYGD